MNKQKTIFLDIDGTILYHYGIPNQQAMLGLKILPGVVEKLSEWEENGYRIIIVTSRKESERELTIKQLASIPVQYDHLIMGINRGERIIINDVNPKHRKRGARAINLQRNEGLSNIKL